MRTHVALTSGIFLIAGVLLACQPPRPSSEQVTPDSSADPHGWIGTETVKTPYGDFAFKNGYPTPESAEALLDQLKFNRAIEVYLTQMPAVSIVAEHRGLADFGAAKPNQIIIWESLMDAKTVLLTANTETVYALGHLDLKADGPTVIEAPPKMLGFAMDALQRYLVDIGPLGPDKGKGGKYLFLPPGYAGEVPQGYFVSKSPTYTVSFGVRGFKVDGKTDQAVALMKQIKVYPLASCNGLQLKWAGTAIRIILGPHSLHLATPPGQDSVPLRQQSAARDCNPSRQDHILCN